MKRFTQAALTVCILDILLHRAYAQKTPVTITELQKIMRLNGHPFFCPAQIRHCIGSIIQHSKLIEITSTQVRAGDSRAVAYSLKQAAATTIVQRQYEAGTIAGYDRYEADTTAEMH